MQGHALKLRTALPSLVPLPEFKCLNPRDRLWEIKANSLFNLYIKRKCFYDNYCSLLRVMGVTSIGTWDKIQNPVEGVKAITDRMARPVG